MWMVDKHNWDVWIFFFYDSVLEPDWKSTGICSFEEVLKIVYMTKKLR